MLIIKMSKLKDKKRILKSAREKQVVMYKRIPIKLSADFSTKTLQVKREWHDIFNGAGGGTPAKNILLAKLSF